MIHLKSESEIEAIARAGTILARLLDEIPARIRPGVTTGELDAFAERFILDHDGADPAFQGLYGFPASICASVNEEVVHGIPRADRTLQEGDTISVDAGVRLDGWFADSARTYPVGDIDAETQRLLDTTREALDVGIQQAVAGNRVGDIGHAVQTVAEAAGFTVVRELVGHGLGRGPHEEPQIPNYGRAGRGQRLDVGLVIAIEPMVNAGVEGVRTLADRWTVVTLDGRRSAHFEHTIASTRDGPRILTPVGA
ncbi:MAG TPA: type I methionyl aminopeptidase [Longimicrobiales bacterium]|nr:type I methionyl aminopeptidase [Longimicrobiales bacterium]